MDKTREVITLTTPVRGRFAPTPSGNLHIGNALSALLAWWQVRQQHGTFILRVEDLDPYRHHREAVSPLLDDLYWLGLDWDEGPDVGGPHAPYTQRDRSRLYQATFEQLRAQGLVYPCYCSRKDLRSSAQAPHGLASEGPVYDGRCRRLSPDERAERAKEKAPAWRFVVPEEPLDFVDLVAGQQSVPPEAGGDFVVFRADGVYGYQLAVVADDAAMGITHVLRGDDLLDSTPRQLWLYRALGCQPPQFAHVPLVLSPDGTRLAKRDQSVTVRSLREQGVRPESLAGYLAWLAGLLAKPEAVAARDLIAEFDIGCITRTPIQLRENWMEDLPS